MLAIVAPALRDDKVPPNDPKFPARGTKADVQRLVDILASLRSPDGCPWDREQDHRSLAPYLIEEAHEFIDTLERLDPKEMTEELGDVLLQVVFHAQLGAERGEFDMQDVADAISDKMIRRHPHVFGDEDAASPDEVTRRWNEIKRAEGKTRLGGVPRSLPALDRARRVTAKAAEVGFDWDLPAQVLDKLDEERAELLAALDAGDSDAIEDELGDVLFVIANLARKLDVDPEKALHRTVAKFERRFTHIESSLAGRGSSLDEASLAEMEALWVEAKANERHQD